MERTLLLSQGYEPLATISWQRAVSLLTLGKVEVVEEYDRTLRSTFLVIKMARDRWKCQYCGSKVKTHEMTMDHVVPRSQGGTTCWENIVTSCEPCNAAKADRTPEQAKMKLRKKPARPNWVPIFSIQLSGAPPEQWASYVYWTAELEA